MKATTKIRAESGAWHFNFRVRGETGQTTTSQPWRSHILFIVLTNPNIRQTILKQIIIYKSAQIRKFLLLLKGRKTVVPITVGYPWTLSLIMAVIGSTSTSVKYSATSSYLRSSVPLESLCIMKNLYFFILTWDKYTKTSKQEKWKTWASVSDIVAPALDCGMNCLRWVQRKICRVCSLWSDFLLRLRAPKLRPTFDWT